VNIKKKKETTKNIDLLQRRGKTRTLAISDIK
jgi:hypothetical protein